MSWCFWDQTHTTTPGQSAKRRPGSSAHEYMLTSREIRGGALVASAPGALPRRGWALARNEVAISFAYHVRSRRTRAWPNRPH